MTAEGSNPDLDDGNPGRATDLGNACVRAQPVRACLWRAKKCLECEKAPYSWLKNPFCSNPGRGVPVHLNGVPVHFSHCPFLSRVYRYT